jgi:hypothetical protein
MAGSDGGRGRAPDAGRRQPRRAEKRAQRRGRAVAILCGVLLGLATTVSRARADDAAASTAGEPNLVKQANAPISNILQLRLQSTYLPEFDGLKGRGNSLVLGLTMPLPEYRLLPVRQLSLLTIPAAVTLPDGKSGFGSTEFGDLRLLDIAVLRARDDVIFGIGPSLVFPTASSDLSGQGKWQLGPAAVLAFTPGGWLVGVLAQNPISFAGSTRRAFANALFLQPFVTYQLGQGWFVRSQPQMLFDWQSGAHIVPLDLGVGRVFRVGGQHVNLFVEPFWNVARDGPVPVYGITVGAALLYPDFWKEH